MVDVEKLMFRREHFPIPFYEAQGKNGRKWWEIDRVEVPPYHPSMREAGIPFELVQNLIEGVLEETVNDLREVVIKRPHDQILLQDLEFDPETGRIKSKHTIEEQTKNGISVVSVPIIGHFYVGKTDINPYGYNGDQGIAIYPEHCAPSFNVPENVAFTPELMREYEMTDGGILLERRRMECPHLWYRHNLGDINAIFYKNLVIALDNTVVRRKYAGDKK